MQARPKAIKRILVGTDFSRHARNAVLRATLLAAEHSAGLEIVHVAPHVSRARLERLGFGSFARCVSDVQCDEHLAEAKSVADSQGVAATVRLLRGSAPAILTHEAHRRRADLVVLGFRGERSLRDALIGTTAERVMERWTGDTLIVKNPPKATYAAILACVALGPVSCSVVMTAAALSEQARLHVLHAYEPPFEMKLVSHHAGDEALAHHRAVARHEAVRALDKLLERCPVTSDRHLERHVLRGEPSSSIPRMAARHGATVVVIGKNQSALDELFLGSVTKKVVRAARTDVVISDPG